MTEKPKTGERIAKRLSRAGTASRREAERMIADGRVKVNGKVITSPALDVTDSDAIEVDGRALAAAQAPRLWLYHKPVGLVTTEKDEKGRDTVFDNLPADLPRVMSIGRLDLTSEGLLLLTNDGEIKRRLELPSTGWQRRYRVRVNGAPDDLRLEPLRKGVVIDGERFQAMEVKLDRQQGANAWLTIGIREGRNREIRRAMEHVGLKVNRLIRVSYGPFQLGELAAGAVEEVKTRVLREQLGLEGAKSDNMASDAPKPRIKPAAGNPGQSLRKTGKPAPRARAKDGTWGEAKPDAKPARRGGKPTATAAKPAAKPAGRPARSAAPKPRAVADQRKPPPKRPAR